MKKAKKFLPMKIDERLLNEIKSNCRSNVNNNKQFFSKLKRVNYKILDYVVLEYHNEVFSETNCTECANCCKSISPILYESDIKRLAKGLKMKIASFKDKYLTIDEDNDYVFRETPCPFLGNDNFCLVYSDRPKACKEYPHTDKKRLYQVLDKTAANMAICPAVFRIVQKLKLKYN